MVIRSPSLIRRQRQTLTKPCIKRQISNPQSLSPSAISLERGGNYSCQLRRASSQNLQRLTRSVSSIYHAYSLWDQSQGNPYLLWHHLLIADYNMLHSSWVLAEQHHVPASLPAHCLVHKHKFTRNAKVYLTLAIPVSLNPLKMTMPLNFHTVGEAYFIIEGRGLWPNAIQLA